MAFNGKPDFRYWIQIQGCARSSVERDTWRVAANDIRPFDPVLAAKYEAIANGAQEIHEYIRARAAEMACSNVKPVKTGGE